MKLKNNIEELSTDDFWYDLTSGGYIKPAKILADKEDVKRVTEAVKVLKEFEKLFEQR